MIFSDTKLTSCPNSYMATFGRLFNIAESLSCVCLSFCSASLRSVISTTCAIRWFGLPLESLSMFKCTSTKTILPDLWMYLFSKNRFNAVPSDAFLNAALSASWSSVCVIWSKLISRSSFFVYPVMSQYALFTRRYFLLRSVIAIPIGALSKTSCSCASLCISASSAFFLAVISRPTVWYSVIFPSLSSIAVSVHLSHLISPLGLNIRCVKCPTGLSLSSCPKNTLNLSISSWGISGTKPFPISSSLDLLKNLQNTSFTYIKVPSGSHLVIISVCCSISVWYISLVFISSCSVFFVSVISIRTPCSVTGSPFSVLTVVISLIHFTEPSAASMRYSYSWSAISLVWCLLNSAAQSLSSGCRW